MVDRRRILRQEVECAIGADIPDADVRAEAVDWLFQSDPRAPFAITIERLTGIPIDDSSAPAVWRQALEIQHRWSGKLRETVTMSAAATEAVVRAREQAAPAVETAAPSLQPYLDRDLLTGLFNRPFYDKRLPEELEQADRTGQPVSLVILELGGINELQGSLSRVDYDDLLRSLGEQVRFHFRPTDLPCRTGDSQISILLPATPPNVAHALADAFVEVTGHRHRDEALTVSVGIATYREDANSARSLERAASLALRRSLTISGGVATYSQQGGRGQQPSAAISRPGSAYARVAGTLLLTALGISAIAFSVIHSFWWQRDETTAPIPPPARHLLHPVSPAAVPPATHAQPHPALLAEKKPSGVPDNSGTPHSLLSAAKLRVDGDYRGAATRLRSLAASQPDLRAQALAAAAAADAATGVDPSPAMSKLSALASRAGDSSFIRNPAAFIQAQWIERKRSPSASLGAYRSAVWSSTSPEARTPPAVGLIRVEEAAGQAAAAAAFATTLATEQFDPARRAAYQILAAEARGRSDDVLQFMLVQPAVLSAPGDLGQAVTVAVARAMAPSRAAAIQGTWKAPYQSIASSSAAKSGVLRLGMELGSRLLAWGVPESAHSLLGPGLAVSNDALHGPKSTVIGAALGPSAESRALFLDGIARRQLGDREGAKTRWIDAIEDRSALPPDVWTPAPDEQWWAAAASLMLGREQPGAFHRLMELEGKQRARTGTWYLQLAAHPGLSIIGPTEAVMPFRKVRRLLGLPPLRRALRGRLSVTSHNYRYPLRYRSPVPYRYPAGYRVGARNRYLGQNHYLGRSRYPPQSRLSARNRFLRRNRFARKRRAARFARKRG